MEGRSSLCLHRILRSWFYFLISWFLKLFDDSWGKSYTEFPVLVLFYFWQIKLLPVTLNCKKYVVTDCLKVFQLHFRSLVMIEIPRNSLLWLNTEKYIKNPPTNCSWNLSNLNFWPKANMQNSTNRKLMNLKLSLNFFGLTC